MGSTHTPRFIHTLLLGIFATFVFLLFVPTPTYATTTVEHAWAKRLGGAGYDSGASITTDASGNVYITGEADSTADLNGDGDSVDGGAESATGYGSGDIVITSFDSSGAHRWAKRLGGTSYDSGNSITTDTSGNVYVMGYANGTADLNGNGTSTDGGAESATGYGNDDIVITSFDASGAHRWAKRLGGMSSDYGASITTDSSGNVYFTGSATGNADLNGDGDSVDGGAESATGYGGYDIIITSFDSSGTHRWATRLGGTGYDRGNSITTDASGNVYIAGNSTGNADLNGNATSTDGGAESATGYGSSDIIITSFDASGAHRWAKRLGGMSSDYGASITTDSSGNVYFTGSATGNADLNGDGDSVDGGAESATGYGSDEFIITSFDASGTHRWAKRLGGVDSDSGYSVTTDSSGNVYFTGSATGNADLNGDGDSVDGAEDSTGYGGYDIIITSFDASGTHRWAKRLGGTGYDEGYSVTTDPSGDVYITGIAEGNADLNGNDTSTDGGAESATGYGSDDIIITVFSPGTPPTLTLDPITATTSPILTGTATDVLSTVSTAEFQLGTTTGAWSACTADDSTFDEASEPFTCTLGTFTPATYTVYVRTTDTASNTTAGGDEESASFTVPEPEEEAVSHGSSGSRAKRPESTPPPTPTPASTPAPTTPAVTALIMQHRALFIAARDLGITIPQWILDLVESTPASFRFTQDLSLGVRHPEVQHLQQFLNTHSFTVAQSGPGSAGNETTYFGPATQSAVAKFQEAYKEDILTPFGLTTPTGQFRARSIEKANALLAEMS